jgi:peroxiredoxin
MKTGFYQSTGRLSLALMVLAQSAFFLMPSGPLQAADAGSQPQSIPAIPMVPAKPEPAGSAAAQAATLQAGALAPDFSSEDPKGRTVGLSAWKGKVVVLDFWATWCGPCQKSLPHTQEVAKELKDQGVVVLAVCTSDSRANFAGWMGKNQAKYPDVNFTCDPNERGGASYGDRASKKLYGVTGIPTQFIIGRDGTIAAVVVGYSEGDTRLEAAVARAGVKVDAALVAKGEAQFRKGD